MGKLIMWNLVSVDGYFEGTKPWALEWFHHRVQGEALVHILEQLRTADMLIFGRKTYEGMFDYWQNATGDIAGLMNALPKVVFSRTLDRADWNNTRLVSTDPAPAVAGLKAQVKGNILIFGSAELSTALIEAELFDEYRLGLTPVLLGRGRPLFAPSAKKLELTLLEARPISDGMFLLRYAPEARLSAQT